MADINNLFDRFLNPQPLEYTRQEGNIRYLDGKGLARPQKMPAAQKAIAVALVALGVVLGLMFLNNTVYETARQALIARQSIESNIARESSLTTVPNLAQYASMSDEDVLATMDGQGFSYYNMTTPNDPGISVYKIPADVSLPDAELLLQRGIGSLSASQATLLLNGSWSLSTSHENNYTIVVRYADFASSTAENAISQAIAHQGIDPMTSTETGTDDSGNLYNQGSIEANGASYTWRVSAIQLDKMYDISGLPDNSYYVGVRLTEN